MPTSVVKSHWEAVEEGARRSGRVPDRSKWRVAREIYVADTTEQARKDALDGAMRRDYEQFILRSLSRIHMLGMMKVNPEMPDAGVTPEYLLDEIWIVGSPGDVTDTIRQLHGDGGGFGVQLAVGHECEPKDSWVNSMTLLAEEVMSGLADLS